ncbi:class I SAM-dependent methyltransferase [Rubripirellula amarantea]|nr:class I SAM-dependent methyltransferase [Rubripirellula amarantea]
MTSKVLPMRLAWRQRLWLLRNLFDHPLGQVIYRRLQIYSSFHRSPVYFAKKRDQIIHLIDLAIDSGCSVSGSRVVEIGTGWVPLMPFILWLMGAREIHSVDLYRHLLPVSANRIIRWLVNDRDSIEMIRQRADEKHFGNRLAKALQQTEPASLFDNPPMHYHAPADACSLELADRSVDLVLSNVTLEHIPAPTIAELFEEMIRILKPSGRTVHLVDPSDHSSHHDPNISPVHFLRYDDATWEHLSGTGIAYHNRLRVPDYKKLIQASSFRIERFDSTTNPKSLEDLKSFRPAEPRWREYSDDDLAKQYLTFVAAADDRIQS